MKVFNVVPKFKPRNRQELRFMLSEIRRISDQLEPIEYKFLNFLFNFEESIEYKDLYNSHLEEYKEAIKSTESIVKPKSVTIDPDYFFKVYYPIEKDQKFFALRWFDKLIEIVRNGKQENK